MKLSQVNIDELTREELLRYVSKQVKEACDMTTLSIQTIEKTLQELPQGETGLEAILNNPKRYADIIEDLELEKIVKEREDQPEIEIDINDL